MPQHSPGFRPRTTTSAAALDRLAILAALRWPMCTELNWVRCSPGSRSDGFPEAFDVSRVFSSQRKSMRDRLSVLFCEIWRLTRFKPNMRSRDLARADFPRESVGGKPE